MPTPQHVRLPDPAHATPSAGTANAPSAQAVGVWRSRDGFVRHVLGADGRHVESRGSREAVFRGRYRIESHRIEYLDDSGFVAWSELRGNVLHHAGMVLYRDTTPCGRD